MRCSPCTFRPDNKEDAEILVCRRMILEIKSHDCQERDDRELSRSVTELFKGGATSVATVATAKHI